MSNHTIERCPHPKPQLLEQILALQENWIVDRSSKNLENGFLISKFSLLELSRLLKGANLFTVTNESSELMAYALCTHHEEFTHLYGPGTQGSIDFEASSIPNDCTYLYQIAIHKENVKSQIAYELLTHIKKLSSGSIVTDVLIEPLRNERSLKFFRRNGFQELGLLHLEDYRDFGKLVSQVLIWKPRL